jgi:nucleoid DNA-binding protein
MIPLNISKRDLWHYVNRKIKRLIHHYHVFSVISILFEEMLKDLRDGKEIKITNLGTIILKDTPPRRYHDVRFQQMMESPGYRIMRIFLAKPIRKKLVASLDLDSTLKDNYHE